MTDNDWLRFVGEHDLGEILLADDLVLDVALRVMDGGGAFSHHIADELMDGYSDGRFTRSVARVLTRLATEGGGIVRLRPRSGSGPLLWFPAGVRLSAHERRQYVVA